MKPRKRIGILTSGGDCPGLNFVIRAVVRHATLTYGWEVLGIPYATLGLQERKTMLLNIHGLDLHGIDPLLSIGGTILGSINKGDTLEHTSEILAGYEALGLDALIAVGGDGSLGIIRDLARKGNWNFVGIPKTIDNDVALTTWSIGFDSAVNTVVDALNRLTYTAASHDRVMVVEVMGRAAGHLALHAGIAGGVDCIIIPEIPYSIHGICQSLAELRDRWGHRFGIVVVAEGATAAKDTFNPSDICQPGKTPACGMGHYIADQISCCTNHQIDVRTSVLGHIQRGGLPSALDRLIATVFGQTAVDLVAQEQYDSMVAWINGQAIALPIDEVLQRSPSSVDPHSYLVQTARALGIYIGDTITAADYHNSAGITPLIPND
jgi:ATP-dependent phosphofructokinase / diphosphate-dependent phosphofructokinase